MPPVDVKTFFPNGRGLVDSRRKEIENGPFGLYEKIYKEEFDKKFKTLEDIAKIYNLPYKKLRVLCQQYRPRYIVESNTRYYPIEELITTYRSGIESRKRAQELRDKEAQERPKKKKKKGRSK